MSACFHCSRDGKFVRIEDPFVPHVHFLGQDLPVALAVHAVAVRALSHRETCESGYG